MPRTTHFVTQFLDLGDLGQRIASIKYRYTPAYPVPPGEPPENEVIELVEVLLHGLDITCLIIPQARETIIQTIKENI